MLGCTHSRIGSGTIIPTLAVNVFCQSLRNELKKDLCISLVPETPPIRQALLLHFRFQINFCICATKLEIGLETYGIFFSFSQNLVSLNRCNNYLFPLPIRLRLNPNAFAGGVVAHNNNLFEAQHPIPFRGKSSSKALRDAAFNNG